MISADTSVVCSNTKILGFATGLLGCSLIFTYLIRLILRVILSQIIKLERLASSCLAFLKFAVWSSDAKHKDFLSQRQNSVADIKCRCDYLSAWSSVRDKLSHDKIPRSSLSKPHSDSTLHRGRCIRAKVSVLLCVWKVFFLSAPCASSCQNKQSGFWYICGEVVNCILPVSYEIKIKFGSKEFAADHVQGLWQATNKESEGFSYLRQTFPKISEINITRSDFLWSTK